jgi:hypothetical protein
MIAFYALMLGILVGLPIGAALGSDLGRHGKVEVVTVKLPTLKVATRWRKERWS